MVSPHESIRSLHPFSISTFVRVDWRNYPKLLDEPVPMMTDLIEVNWNFIGLANTLLKYHKSMIIGQTIKIIITRIIRLMNQFIYWSLESNIRPWYGFPLMLTEANDIESLRGYWSFPLLKKNWPEELYLVMTMVVICVVESVNGGNGTKT